MKIRAVLFLLLAGSSSLFAQLSPVNDRWVGKTLKSMTIEEKVGQLFIPAHVNLEQTSEWVRKYRVGGIWFSRVEAKKIAEELNHLQRISKVPLLVTVDFEKGAGTYVDGATDLPIAMALGASRDPKLVYEAAALTAREARALGVHMNFAPVLDVNNNPDNPVINTRSYGENPQLVAEFAAAAIKGYQDHGLLATGKHFPGHGNTTTDTHAKLGVVMSTPAEFDSVELYPYKYVLKNARPSGIMSTHLWVPAIDQDTIPATLSKQVVTNLLRERLGFGGIILTDAMVMGGITRRYSCGDATVKALQAGCDVILFADSLAERTGAVIEAVKRGDLSKERLDESVRRVLMAKTRVGLVKRRSVEVAKIPGIVGTKANYAEAKRIAARCITLAKDETGMMPLRASEKILVLSISNRVGNSIMSRGLVSFPNDVKKLSPDAMGLLLSDTLRSDECDEALRLAQEADVVVVAAFIKIVLSSGTVDLPPTHIAFLRRLVKQNPKVVLVSFGNPYIGASVPEVPAYICAYDNAKTLQETAAEALFGKARLTGKLPVTISDVMKYGTGLTR